MSERTDGHWLDTGNGPKPIALASGVAMEGKTQAAYRAYLDHMRDCEDCPKCTFQCDVAAALWQVYRESRGHAAPVIAIGEEAPGAAQRR